MTKEDFKKQFFCIGSNNTAYMKAQLERFFDENENITIENFSETYKKFEDWRTNEKNVLLDKLRCSDEVSRMLFVDKFFEDNLTVTGDNVIEVYNNWMNSLIKIGLEATARREFQVLDNTQDGDWVVVYSPETRLRGIMTTGGDIVVPCIFEELVIKCGRNVFATFKNNQYNVSPIPMSYYEEEDNRCYLYGTCGAYSCLDVFSGRQRRGANREITQELYNILRSWQELVAKE